MGTETFTIGALASATGTKVETIRYYERIGLLPRPARSRSNYRSFTHAHLNRLVFLRRARSLGFSLGQVRELLQMVDQRDSRCADVDRITHEHLITVERKILDLKRLATELRRLSALCRGGVTVADCRIIEALASATQPPSPAYPPKPTVATRRDGRPGDR